MATAPSRSISPLLLLLLLLSGTHPPTMLSTQWYCFDCCYTRLGGCTLWGGRISHNLKSRSYRQGRMRAGGWTDGRRAVSLHPAARTWSSGDDTLQLVKKRKRLQVVNAITDATDQAHTHLLFRFRDGSCALTSVAKQDEHGEEEKNTTGRILIYFNAFETLISH